MPEYAADDMQDLSPPELARLVYFNGINGATGEALAPNIERQQLGAKVQVGPKANKKELAELKQRSSPLPVSLGVEAEAPESLSEAGWGIIFAADDPHTEHVREALSPLLTRRCEEAGGQPHYQEYTGESGYRQGETAHSFLERHGVGPGPAVPALVPYYLLIVGDPARIPFEFQQGLDVQYAVGRLHFATPEEYRHYAESVVNAEKGALRRPRQAAFFGVRNPGDGATQLSAQNLVTPLAQQLSERLEVQNLDWRVDQVPVAAAKKQRLGQLLGGTDTPALLFTASHGCLFPPGHARRTADLGALICGDWVARPGQAAPLTPDHLMRAQDIADNHYVAGLIAFMFACFGAGMPAQDSFAHWGSPSGVAIGPAAALAPLPQRLLGHPNGGALAVIGHVDRALPSAFYWPRSVGHEQQLAVFRQALWMIMQGHRVGYALEFFSQRYAELSTIVSEELARRKWEEVKITKETDEELASYWLANNDARSYVILGDPAVRASVSPAQPPVTAAERAEEAGLAQQAQAVAEAAMPDVRFRHQAGVARSFPCPGAPAPVAGEAASNAAAQAAAGPVAPALAGLGGANQAGITISTWAADDVGNPQKTTLKARTRISPAGDVDTYLPATITDADAPYLESHRAAISQVIALHVAHLPSRET